MDGGYVYAIGHCWSCNRMFNFDPELVPSLPVDPETNLPADLGGDPAKVVKQPICRHCVAKANRLRAANDRQLIHVPEGAYL